jgi:uncharacterized protein YuzE
VRGETVEAGLILEYDRVGDILYIHKTAPYPEQESDEIDDGVIARLNPKTGEIENLEILFFSARVSSSEGLKLPIIAELRLPEST